jgi:hypothetical protein
MTSYIAFTTRYRAHIRAQLVFHLRFNFGSIIEKLVRGEFRRNITKDITWMSEKKNGNCLDLDPHLVCSSVRRMDFYVRLNNLCTLTCTIFRQFLRSCGPVAETTRTSLIYDVIFLFFAFVLRAIIEKE